MMRYQHPDTQMTLQEGLDEYYASRNDLQHGRGISARATDFFRCHDTVHVVFGCDTTLPSEAAVKMWSFFGTNAGLKRLHQGYALEESKEIYTNLGVWQMVDAGLRSLVIVPAVIFNSWRMKKRWHWSDFDHYLTMPLSAIRHEFGIRIIQVG